MQCLVRMASHARPRRRPCPPVTGGGLRCLVKIATRASASLRIKLIRISVIRWRPNTGDRLCPSVTGGGLQCLVRMATHACPRRRPLMYCSRETRRLSRAVHTRDRLCPPALGGGLQCFTGRLTSRTIAAPRASISLILPLNPFLLSSLYAHSVESGRNHFGSWRARDTAYLEHRQGRRHQHGKVQSRSQPQPLLQLQPRQPESQLQPQP